MNTFLLLLMILSFFIAFIIAWNVESPIPMFIFLLMFLNMSICFHFERKSIQQYKTKLACINSKQLVERHFTRLDKMVQSGVASKFQFL